jgi:hypothetical protein
MNAHATTQLSSLVGTYSTRGHAILSTHSLNSLCVNTTPLQCEWDLIKALTRTATALYEPTSQRLSETCLCTHSNYLRIPHRQVSETTQAGERGTLLSCDRSCATWSAGVTTPLGCIWRHTVGSNLSDANPARYVLEGTTLNHCWVSSRYIPSVGKD